MAVNKHTPPELVPPWQSAVMSVSGKSLVTMPHEHWFHTQLSWTVSNCPPETSMPAPMGAMHVMPEHGTFGLLLSWTRLCWMKVQERPEPSGQRPLCGGGLSSLLSE